MLWFLFLVSFAGNEPQTIYQKKGFERMDECFLALEKTKQELGPPIENQYQLVCVSKQKGIGT